MYFKLTETDSNIVFAIIKAKKDCNSVIKNTKKVKKLVALAVKEEWCYETVNLVDWNYNESNNQMSFDCITEDGGEEIRAIDLSLTFIYK